MKTSLARFVYVAVFVVTVGYAVVAFPQGMRAWHDTVRQAQDMEKRNDALAKVVERQKEYIDRLKNNRNLQELEARRRLKLLHPDEKQYVTGDTEAPAQLPAGK